MKIKDKVEEIFSQAVALDQSGGLRNTIYASDSDVYILNYDHTVLLQFRLRREEGRFDQALSFKANDYDSNEFELKDNRIIFHSEKGEYQRKKICGTTDLTPEEVRELFKSYIVDKGERETVSISSDALELLDEDLSHVEFSGKAGETIKMIQRNIYSGGIIEIQKTSKGMFAEVLKNDFGPVAIKTSDLRALFNFQSNIYFSFPLEQELNYILIRSVNSNDRAMSGVIACCLYDEIIRLQTSKPEKEEDEKQTTITRRNK